MSCLEFERPKRAPFRRRLSEFSILPDQRAPEVEFPKLCAGCDDISLPRLLIEIARDAYPQLDSLRPLMELDRLGERARRALAVGTHDGSLPAKLAIVSRVLFHDEGFHGDQEQYYDPCNSYLHEVLQRRRGIPITLSIVYREVARRAGLPVYGVGTPGHFVVGCEEEGQLWFVDPFALGEVLSFEQCRRRIEQHLGESGVLVAAHFAPANNHSIVVRVLRNLKGTLAQRNSWTELYHVQRRLAALLPGMSDEQRDLGLVALRVGAGLEAWQLLSHYVETCEAEQRAQIEPYLKLARRQVNEFN